MCDKLAASCIFSAGSGLTRPNFQALSLQCNEMFSQ